MTLGISPDFSYSGKHLSVFGEIVQSLYRGFFGIRQDFVVEGYIVSKLQRDFSKSDRVLWVTPGVIHQVPGEIFWNQASFFSSGQIFSDSRDVN